MCFRSRKEGVQGNCGGKFQTYEVLKSMCHIEGRATRGSGGRKAILTQNRKRELGPTQKDLGPRETEKLRSEVGPRNRGHGPCSVLEELPV